MYTNDIYSYLSKVFDELKKRIKVLKSKPCEPHNLIIKSKDLSFHLETHLVVNMAITNNDDELLGETQLGIDLNNDTVFDSLQIEKLIKLWLSETDIEHNFLSKIPCCEQVEINDECFEI